MFNITLVKITEKEFQNICQGILDERESIIRHNPVGTDEEVLLWMLLSSLTLYLSLSEIETPCFTGRPDADTYRDAISFILRDRKNGDFEIGPYLDKLVKQ